ncbi:gag-polypeptide of LTR copia-type [Nitzschia inconspicua]|uniref:Gag-polypeptide of LTR copia-type n=1 Tax=Nitzschia inconspicua TaxID=303405 RepID=A0A9K3PZT2_9STRA|nr:gag-polypeptide of LTR copia-type [Nitzschia inconspicua]KAG7365636.1 gag-polypeptide of LTR copia-type [Nitzschia inconspicua]
MLSVNDKISYKIVKKATSTDFPQGDATKAWKALQKRWEPKGEIDKQNITDKFFSSTLKDLNVNPEDWITDLEEMQERLDDMGEKISDSMLTSHILHNVPEEYKVVVDMLSRNKTKTIESVKKELKAKWDRMKEAGTVTEKDTALHV